MHTSSADSQKLAICRVQITELFAILGTGVVGGVWRSGGLVSMISCGAWMCRAMQVRYRDRHLIRCGSALGDDPGNRVCLVFRWSRMLRSIAVTRHDGVRGIA